MTTSPSPSDNSPLQLLFLGTGTSTGLPLTPCLTLTQPYPDEFAHHLPLAPPRSNPPPGHFDPEGEWPNNIPCACCRAAVSEDVPEGWKNRRGNTSVIVRKSHGGQWKNVIVDVGKTFREQSARFFPRWGVDRIDAVILTHGHADAYYGLDDLREWCFRQECFIPVYLNRETYETVAMSFPYLVDRKKASGGGDVPALRFHIIEDDADFEVEGIRVRALPVEHGIYFRDDERKPLICLGFMFDESIIYMSDVSEIPERTWSRMLDRTPPPLSAMTKFNETNLSQPSETSYESPNRPKSLPERLKEKIDNATTTGKGKVVIPPTPKDTPLTSRSHSPDLASLSLTPTTSPPASSGSTNTKSLPILIIDSLWPLQRHSSHIHFIEALRIAMRLKPAMTYLVDLVHPVSHYMWEELCYSLKGENGKRGTGHPDNEQAQELIGRFWRDKSVGRMKNHLKAWEGKVEPGWDGLVVEGLGDEWKVVKGKNASGRGIAL